VVNPTGRAATDSLLHSILSLRPVEVAFAARVDAATGFFVLDRAARGRGNRQLAHDLGLTEQTVTSYLRAAMAKLNSRTRGEAVSRARSTGLLA
jgi:DNA-binding CsgD family transcriptional regulator